MGDDDPPVSSEALPAIRFGIDGLVPVVAQQWDTGEVLMLAWMDAEALRRTMATGQATYYSRSRREYWVKGATSGNRQHVRRVSVDCDSDAVLLHVDQVGVACHTGARSCFDTFHLDLGHVGDLGHVDHVGDLGHLGHVGHGAHDELRSAGPSTTEASQ